MNSTSSDGAGLKFEIGHVLFIDIVGYSKLLIDPCGMSDEEKTQPRLEIAHVLFIDPDYSIALVYLGLGDQDQAMNSLEKSFAEGQPDLNTIRFDPLLKPLHGNPRFEALAEKIAPARVLASLVTAEKKSK